MNEIEYLRDQRKLVWKRVRSSHMLYVRAKRLYECLKKRWEEDEKAYEDIDHQLAILDGRLQKLEAAKHTPKLKRLSNSQIKELLLMLGAEADELDEIIEDEPEEGSDD